MDTNATNAAQPKPRRRWYQFGLRTLLIVVTLAGSGLGWLGIKVRDARVQAAAVAAIQKQGGLVIYDYQFDAHDVSIEDAAPPVPNWLRSVLGDDFFCSVYHVTFDDPFVPVRTASGFDLEQLKVLTQLRSLELAHRPVTDYDLEQLKGLKHLTDICLNDTQATDAGLAHLKGLTRLKTLDLQHTHVTDAGVAKLQQALPYCKIER